MDYGYVRVSTRGQVDGNSIEDQTTTILKEYPNAEIVAESYMKWILSMPVKKHTLA